MKKKMTIKALKSKLSELEKKDLEQMICNLYKTSEQAEQIINLYVLGDDYSKQLLEEYKEGMYKIFFPKNILRSGFSISKAKKYISEFKKICKDKELLIELELYYVECGVDFTNEYGDISEAFYDSICSVFEDVIETISIDKKLFEKLEGKIKTIIKESDGIGWGFQDYLVEQYEGIPWLEEY